MGADLAAETPFARARAALAAAGVALFFTNLDSYAFAAWSGPPPVLWNLAFVGAALVLVVMEPHRPIALLRSSLGIWIVFFFLLTAVWALWARGLPEQLQELNDRLRSLAFLVAFALIFDDPGARRAAVLAVAASVVLATLLNVAELLSLVTFADAAQARGGRVAGRAAGLYGNANISGLAIALGTAVVVEPLPRVARVPLLVAAAVGIAATFSRGAAICLAVVFLWQAWRRTLGTWSVAATAAGGLALLVYLVGYAESHALLNENTAARLSMAQDDSGRVELALKAWRLFAGSPLLGNGVASTIAWDAPVNAHNMFLVLAADHGVLGLLAFPLLGVALALGRARAGAYAAALMVSGLFSHTMLLNRYALLLTALAAAGGFAPRPWGAPGQAERALARDGASSG